MSFKILLDLLQDFLNNNNAFFTCKEQELLIKSILLKIPYILGILATNKGKTLSYFLTAALATSNITVVVLPLVGLKQDVLRRAKEYNIPCCIYENSNTFLNLTLVSIETILLSTQFNNSLTKLISYNKIDRIIVDKCHLIITSSNYRSIMFQVKELISLQVQFVFLSRTVPIYIEQALRDIFCFKELATIRGITMQENIVYKSK
jgi:superfamily II DNA helicase RecQ